MKAERLVQVLILILIAAMAGAASFTHVHDWTMHNAPPGTGSWFGWANAVISELTPTAAGIEIRRRKRTRQPVTYPMAVLIAAAILSLAAQVAQARPTIAGWLSSAVPALAFLALTKLVLSSPRSVPVKENPECAQTPASRQNPAGEQASTTTAMTTPDGSKSLSETTVPSAQTPTLTAVPTLTASPSDHGLSPLPPAQLLISARMAAFSHHQQTGTPITSGELATRMNLPSALAESLLDHLNDGDTPPSVTAVNGIVMNGSRP
jgi:hypothetical protein